MSATHRPIGDQLRDAAGELYAVLAPAVLFGLIAAAAGLAAGSVLFEQRWITGLLAVVCTVIVAVPITLERIYTLGGQTNGE